MKQKILELLGAGHPWAGSVQYYKTIVSTNDEAKRLANEGAPHGTILIAKQQTGGRGRMGRSFHSPAGTGIYFSVILRPKCQAKELMHLTCAVAVAVCDAIENATAFRPKVKWINDLVAQNKKLGGILTELSLNPDGTVKYAVVGIGINCNQKPEEFPAELENIAISLQTVLGNTVSVEKILAQLIYQLEKLSCNLLSAKEQIMAFYKQDCITIGQQVKVIDSQGTHQGTAVDLREDGALLVQFDDGTTEAVGSGEVSVRGLWGYC